MDDLPLPTLPAGDPRNRLSVEALRRVQRAHLESERIRWAAEAKVEGSGLPHNKGVYVINQACLKAARVVLKVLWKEYADAGLTLQEFWDAMRFEIDGAAGSLQLTGIQKRVLETEFFAPPEQKITRPSSSATPAPVPPKTIDTIAAQINRLRNECHLTAEELAEEVELDSRTVQRHLAGETTPYARHLRIYERVFSKILNRQVVISKMP